MPSSFSRTTFALSNLDLRLGSDEVGLRIGPGGTIAIATLSAPKPATGSTATDTRSWLAVNGNEAEARRVPRKRAIPRRADRVSVLDRDRTGDWLVGEPDVERAVGLGQDHREA